MLRFRGNTISFNEEHPSNALEPIVLTESGILTVLSFLHPLNELGLIETTVLGMTISVTSLSTTPYT